METEHIPSAFTIGESINPTILSELKSHRSQFCSLETFQVDQDTNTLHISATSGSFLLHDWLQARGLVGEYSTLEYENFKGLFLSMELRGRGQVPFYMVSAWPEIKSLEKRELGSLKPGAMVHFTRTEKFFDITGPATDVGVMVTDFVVPLCFVDFSIHEIDREENASFMDNELLLGGVEHRIAQKRRQHLSSMKVQNAPSMAE